MKPPTTPTPAAARPLTMSDIAAHAGVSQSTVSYVLSGTRPIGEQTRQRVLRAIDALGYRPDARARALASGATRALALLLPVPHDELSPVQHTFIAGAAVATSEAEYSLVLSTAPARPAQLTKLLATQRPDGVILMEVAMHDPRMRLPQDAGLPFSLIGRSADDAGTSFVDMDFDHLVSTAVQHLVGLGHRRIVLFNEAIPGRRDYGPAVRAGVAFAETVALLRLDGMEVDSGLGRDAAYATARQVLAEIRPTAALTFGQASTAILAAARDERLRVPDHLSVVGILPPQLAEMLTPALTAIDVPAFEMGRIAAEMLIRRLTDGDASPAHTLLRPALTVRESTARAPRRRPAPSRSVEAVS